MAKIDLNIIDRGTQGTEWFADNNSISADSLSKVVEQKTDNPGALNSLPTPFARFYVAKEAFRRVAEEAKHPGESQFEAGFAYRQMVSDCLDVLELLFNLKFHRNSWKGEDIVIREWERKTKMDDLRKSVPVLYNSLNTYFSSDIKEEKLYFVIYKEDGKEYLLACSSPMTLFVTPPDMDKSRVDNNGVLDSKFEGESYNRLHIVSKSGREYFRDIRLFEERGADFKNYVYSVLFGGANVDDRFREMQDYVKSFKDDPDIRSDYEIKTVPVLTEYNNDLIINGISLCSNEAVDINDLFAESIMKVPYRLSDKDVVGFSSVRGDSKRSYDFLMPLKPQVLAFFDGVPDCECHIKNDEDVVVTLKYNGEEYTREYETNGSGLNGKIYDLKLAKQNFDMGLFPNILSEVDAENNYFKVLMAISDLDNEAPQLTIDKVSLSFYKRNSDGVTLIKEEVPNQQFDYGVRKPVVRTRTNNAQDRQYVKYESKFYEVFNSAFDAIELNILGHHALIIPKWRHSKRSNASFRYAVDLGTSNTFVARCEVGQNNLPELFDIKEPMVSYLHAESKDEQISITSRIEDSIFEEGRKAFVTEFVPPIIDKKKYKFPIRTALCHVKNNTDSPTLFDNHNIAFFYEKEMETNKQEILTDIKWESNEGRLSIFVRELLVMIKADVLQRNGDLDCTELIWFRPLTFPGNISQMYEEVWKKEPQLVMNVGGDKVKCYTESEAPYYYFKKKGVIINSEAATVIDIGGGSTDFVYFEDNKPILANSVHFGCDVLWNNGSAEFENMRENGIYNHYVGTIDFKTPHLKEINDGLVADKKTTTRDIINFWIDNAEDCGITRSLSMDFKPVFVYHLTSILFYMANMYKVQDLKCPRTIIFSGNGSKYIDKYISPKEQVLKEIIDLILGKVFGESDVHIELPTERKESTCYGGLYREAEDKEARDCYYQGTGNKTYKNVGEIIDDYDSIKSSLGKKYKELLDTYREVLAMLKHDRILDNSVKIEPYIEEAKTNLMERLDSDFVKEVKEKFSREDTYYGSIFFLPIIDKVFELTKV